VIAAEDTRHTAKLLARHAITTSTTSLHEHNEASKSPSLIARLGRGESVALVSDAGTPTVSDPGSRLIRDAIEAGIRVEPVPGPSAVIAAMAVAGLPSQGFSFHGFPPVRAKDRNMWFARLIAVGGTVVFFEAPHRIQRTLSFLQEKAGDCEVVVAREMTKTHEELVRGPISTVLRRLENPRGELTVVAKIGFMPEQNAVGPENPPLTKRATIAALAKSYGVSTNDVYAALEGLRNSGK
jgi:16S rRNA (cytidine1402-2'-O)-methyltransferase